MALKDEFGTWEWRAVGRFAVKFNGKYDTGYSEEAPSHRAAVELAERLNEEDGYN